MNRHDMKEKNDNYSTRYEKMLSDQQNMFFAHDPYYDCRNIRYFHLKSMSMNLSENSAYVVNESLKKMLLSQWSLRSTFYYILKSDGNKLSIYVGTDNTPEELGHIVSGAFPGTVYSSKLMSFGDLFNKNLKYMGIFGGNPIVRKYSPEAKNEFSPTDELMAGTVGIPWFMCIAAHPVSYGDIRYGRENWVKEVSESSEYCSASYSSDAGDGGETINTEKRYTGSESYFNLAQRFLNVFDEALSAGQWGVTATLYSSSSAQLKLVGNLLSSSLRSGEDEIERPFPFMFHPQQGIKSNVQPSFQVGDERSQFYLTSLELASLCSFPTRDSAGFPIQERADFDISRIKEGNLKIGHILNQGKLTPQEYSLDVNSLNRHGLIIGLTGGGKTNTVKSLLYSISSLDLPFMVIEPAKKEYYEIYRMGIKDLQVYSVGGMSGNLLKINPFECIEGIPLQSHIDVVFAAFKASFVLYSPMPYVLENAIYEIYKDYGWNVETGVNEYGKREFPTIEDLYYKIKPVVVKMGYDSRMQNDLIGSLTARVNSLRMGAKGRSLNVEKSTPLSELLKGKVVIELDDIGDEDTKAFIISLILMQLQECRKSEVKNYQLGVRHLLLIEEAHRLLKNVSGGTGENADPRGAAVEYFCNMLAEIRSKGQGFLVIDQIPSKLAQDLVKNTNLKIVHRTVDTEDRELMGGAMHMTDSQKEYLACLEQGVAAVYSEGDDRPKQVKMPYAGEYEKMSGLANLSRERILELTERNCVSSNSSYEYWNQSGVNRICAHCPRRYQCIKSVDYLENVKRSIQPFETSEQFFRKIMPNLKAVEVLQSIAEAAGRRELVRPGYSTSDLRRCLFALWLENISPSLDYGKKSSLLNSVLDAFK